MVVRFMSCLFFPLSESLSLPLLPPPSFPPPLPAISRDFSCIQEPREDQNKVHRLHLPGRTFCSLLVIWSDSVLKLQSENLNFCVEWAAQGEPMTPDSYFYPAIPSLSCGEHRCVWVQHGRSKSASKASISFSFHFSLSQVEETGLLLCLWPYISSGQTVLVISCLDFVGFPSAWNLRCVPPRTSMWCVLGRQHSTSAAKSEETRVHYYKKKIKKLLYWQ